MVYMNTVGAVILAKKFTPHYPRTLTLHPFCPWKSDLPMILNTDIMTIYSRPWDRILLVYRCTKVIEFVNIWSHCSFQTIHIDFYGCVPSKVADFCWLGIYSVTGPVLLLPQTAVPGVAGAVLQTPIYWFINNVICHLSHGMCHLSLVTCHMSSVTCHNLV